MVEKGKYRTFKKLSTATLISVYVLILVGGIVRSTGSGMGCPDWPKCFGEIVPPTDVSQLPPDYKAYYASYRQKKNDRFADYLDALGMHSKAAHIRTDTSILQEADFNVFKTWTEFINRLLGALTGLLIVATMVYSFRFVKKDFTLVLLTVGTFVLVLFQGWLGSVVVSTNLLSWTVTLHMLMALVIVVMLTVIVMRVRKRHMQGILLRRRGWMQLLAGTCLLAMGAQILLGTQVREAIDVVSAALSFEMRDTWIARTGEVFLAHRTFSLMLLVLNGLLAYYSYKLTRRPNKLRISAVVLMGLLLTEVLLGVILAYAGIPPIAQPVHLLISTLLFGLLVVMYILIRNSSTAITADTQL